MAIEPLLPGPWPEPADAAAGQRLVERFAEASEPAAALAGSVQGAAMLAAVGGGSPFLADLVVREHGFVLATLRDGPDAALAGAMAALDAIGPDAGRAVVVSALREAKRQVGLVTALADLGGAWGLAQVTGALTTLAETTCGSRWGTCCWRPTGLGR